MVGVIVLTMEEESKIIKEKDALLSLNSVNFWKIK